MTYRFLNQEIFRLTVFLGDKISMELRVYYLPFAERNSRLAVSFCRMPVHQNCISQLERGRPKL